MPVQPSSSRANKQGGVSFQRQEAHWAPGSDRRGSDHQGSISPQLRAAGWAVQGLQGAATAARTVEPLSRTFHHHEQVQQRAEPEGAGEAENATGQRHQGVRAGQDGEDAGTHQGPPGEEEGVGSGGQPELPGQHG